MEKGCVLCDVRSEVEAVLVERIETVTETEHAHQTRQEQNKTLRVLIWTKGSSSIIYYFPVSENSDSVLLCVHLCPLL
jgi:hypothetical protein